MSQSAVPILYLGFGLTGACIGLVIMLALIKKLSTCSGCGSAKTTKVQGYEEKDQEPELKQSKETNKPYVVLEDHLDLIESPDDSINLTSKKRPVSGMLVPSKQTQMRPQTPDIVGVTLDFVGDDSTVILVEGRGDKISRITRTKVILEEKMRDTSTYVSHKGWILDSVPVTVFVLAINEARFEKVKEEIVNLDKSIEKITPHPRYIRYHGTCFNSTTKEAYVITDFFAGCTFQEIWNSEEVRDAMSMTENEKIQAAADVSESIFFLHRHSKPIVHGDVGLASVVVDGETHRAKLLSHHFCKRFEIIKQSLKDIAHEEHNQNADLRLQESAPELLQGSLSDSQQATPSVYSDIWSVGATILEILTGSKTWDIDAMSDVKNLTDDFEATIKLAIELESPPSIVSTSKLVLNPRLWFLLDCLSYNPQDRPEATFILRGMQQAVKSLQRESDSDYQQPLLDRKKTNSTRIDPLFKQQIEWHVKQDNGYRKRAILFGTRNYQGKRFKSLSVTPINDIKIVSGLLEESGFALNHSYDDISSSTVFEDILRTYVEAVNRENEEIDILVVFYSGLGVQGLPSRLVKKRRLGLFLDRLGISHDLALVTANESLLPVAKMQSILASLHAKVKRKVVILDCRLYNKRKKSSSNLMPPEVLTPGSMSSPFKVAESPVDWDVPVIPEESLDKITTMFTLYPIIEHHVSLAAMDSHPSRTNGFLTGCLVDVIKDQTSSVLIEDLPRLLNDEMAMLANKAKAFNGISCKADFIESEMWMVPIVSKD